MPVMALVRRKDPSYYIHNYICLLSIMSTSSFTVPCSTGKRISLNLQPQLLDIIAPQPLNPKKQRAGTNTVSNVFQNVKVTTFEPFKCSLLSIPSPSREYPQKRPSSAYPCQQVLPKSLKITVLPLKNVNAFTSWKVQKTDLRQVVSAPAVRTIPRRGAFHRSCSAPLMDNSCFSKVSTTMIVG